MPISQHEIRNQTLVELQMQLVNLIIMNKC